MKKLIALTVSVSTLLFSCSDNNNEPRILKTSFQKNCSNYHVFITKGMQLDTVEVVREGKLLNK